jgi:hypothetical protein
MTTPINELMTKDAAGQLSDGEFDDALWLGLCERIKSVDALERFPEPVRTYYASRYVEWEVGNGGFAQAVLNVPEWLEAAAVAFETLGKPLVAELIRQAQSLYEVEKSKLPEVKPGAEPTLSAYFNDNAFNELDEKLEDVDFWSDAARLAYVRTNRAAFLAAMQG